MYAHKKNKEKNNRNRDKRRRIYTYHFRPNKRVLIFPPVVQFPVNKLPTGIKVTLCASGDFNEARRHERKQYEIRAGTRVWQ